MQTRTLFIIGLVLIAFGLGQTLVRMQTQTQAQTEDVRCDCLSTILLVSEPVPVIPPAFEQPTPPAGVTATPPPAGTVEGTVTTVTGAATAIPAATTQVEPTQEPVPTAGDQLPTEPTHTPGAPSSLPPTEVPPTASAPTEQPPTVLPPTKVPPTAAPPTPVPPTAAPPENTSTIAPKATSIQPAPPTNTTAVGQPTLTPAQNLPENTTPTQAATDTAVLIPTFTPTEEPTHTATETPVEATTTIPPVPTTEPTLFPPTSPTGTPESFFTGIYLDISATEPQLHTTYYSIHFSNPNLEGQRSRYQYGWDLFLPPGDQCNDFSLEVNPQQPWEASWTHPGCTHSPGEEVNVSISRDITTVNITGPAVGPAQATPTSGPSASNRLRSSGGRLEGGSALFSPQVAALAQSSAPKVRVSALAPSSMSANVSVPITVSVEPSDAEAASISAALEEYGVTALSASVDGPEFNISPEAPQETQWVNEQRLEWLWVASAKTAGTQTLRVSVTARGKPSWSEEVVEGQIWSGVVQVTVEEQEEGGFNLGSFDLLTPLNTLAGLGLTFPWIHEQYKRRKQRKPHAQEVSQEPASGEE